jgi:uncharacterized 2Fe-2S/4Fe-4S cluster protein (DUF4445 family)
MPEAPDLIQVTFTPSGKHATVAPGATVLDMARSLGVDLDSVCGGRGICGHCQVVATEGEFLERGLVSTRASLTGFTEDEQRYREKRGLASERRLGCRARICSDVIIDIPPESHLHRRVVRKRVEVPILTLDPVVRLYYVTVPAATLQAAKGDVQRLMEALADQ